MAIFNRIFNNRENSTVCMCEPFPHCNEFFKVWIFDDSLVWTGAKASGDDSLNYFSQNVKLIEIVNIARSL